jgi:hypothetical protein
MEMISDIFSSLWELQILAARMAVSASLAAVLGRMELLVFLMRNYLGELVGAGIVALAVIALGDDVDFLWKYLLILAAVFVIQGAKLPRIMRPISTLRSPGGQSFLRMATVAALIVWWYAPHWALALIPIVWLLGRFFLNPDDDMEELPTY